MHEDIVNALVWELLQHVFGEEKMEIKTPLRSSEQHNGIFDVFVFIDLWNLAN